MRALAGAVCALVIATVSASAQDTVLTIRAPGPSDAEHIVEQTLAHRYIIRHEEYNTRLFRDSVFDTTVVVLGSDATVASTVHGDVVVINGDLFLQPGATGTVQVKDRYRDADAPTAPLSGETSGRR